MKQISGWALVSLLIISHVEAAERYTALFTDGARVEEAEVREWFEPTSTAKIAGRALFDANNPARWVIDRQQTSATDAPMFVEFFGGDRVAGEVTEFHSDSGNPYEYLPPHLVVSPASELQAPDDPVANDLRVCVEWIRRVVWQRHGNEEYRPGTVWLRSGGMLTFRTLRWSPTSVTLLTTDGVKELAFSDLAEIHFPRLESWNCYYEQLAVLSPGLNSRLIQLESTDGSCWTTSTERFQARHHGDRNRPEQWYQFLQPAWSLDPVWIRYRTIRAWRFFAPTDVPLSNMLPLDVRRASVFGSGWPWRINQNVQRGPLLSAMQEFGWGFGVQATCDLTFDYPEAGRTWRTQYGLDRSAGSGGFARLSFSTSTGQPIGPRPNVQGSQSIGDTGWLPLPVVPPDQRRLTFHADMAHTDRPPESDPFDIRDSVNWYEPEIRLDPAALKAEVSSRSLGRLNGLHGWTMTPADIQSLNLKNTLESFQPKDPHYRLTTSTKDRFYSATRKLKVGPQHQWLSIVASRFADATPTFVQVKIEDRAIAEFEVPLRNAVADPDPVLIPVGDYAGKTVPLEIVMFPTDDKSFVDWRGLALTNERPGIRTIFEDDPAFATLLNRGAGTVEITNEKPFSGTASLKVTPDAGDNAQIPGLEATISDQPRLGQYQLVVFAWKQPTGTQVAIQFATDGQFREAIDQVGRRGEAFRNRPSRGRGRFEGSPDDRGLRHGFAYDAGTQRQGPGSPLRVHNGSMPKDWQLHARNLFGDFGQFNLTGLSLRCVDGEAAWFDHIYLTRTYGDAEFVKTYLVNPRPAPQPLDPSLLDFTIWRWDYGRILAPFAPQFSMTDSSHGLFRVKEHAGQLDAMRTYPNAPDKPAILRTGMTLPKDKPQMLDIRVSHWAQADWQLVVKVNGEVIHQELINEKLTIPQKGWASIQVDLSKFAGQKVYIEALNQSNNWSNEFGFWKRLAIVDK